MGNSIRGLPFLTLSIENYEHLRLESNTTTEMVARLSFNAVRRFSTSSSRKGFWNWRKQYVTDVLPGMPPPGHNIPIGNIENRWVLTLKMTLFLGSGFALPFIGLRHNMLKKIGE